MTDAPIGRDLAATLAVATYSGVVVVGFARVFSGWSYLADLLVLVAIGHGASFVSRRLGVRGIVAVPAAAMLMVWFLLLARYGDTTSWSLPTATTVDRVELEVGLVRDQFATAVAPVLYLAGWATLAGVAVIIAVLMADAFAFRAEARGEALVPGGVLFVFIAALGTERLRITSAALLVGAGVLAVVALRSLHDRAARVELTTARRPASLLVPGTLATALAIAVVAGMVGPRIPGADAEPLYDTRGRGGDVTEVVSPLVDIRSRLVNRSATELFRVDAGAEAYWRVTTLPEFDGRTFRLPSRALERVDGTFGDARPGSAELRQQVQVLALGGQLVPAAAEPLQAIGATATGTEIELRLNRDTTTLLATTDLVEGDLFTVVSAVPNLGADQLATATSDAPPDPIFLDLPDGLPSIVSELASAVTADATTSFGRARALQDWFRAEFDYSTEVQSGHGSNAIESFLLQRVGYCEQFAATFAAMARTLGLPTRVAVGFTPGELGADGWYAVRGQNAHAWPEVWFDDVGWVAFEPTPGRGAPGAEAYTGVPAEQDVGPATAGDGAGGAPVPTAPSTVVPPVTTVPDAGGPNTTIRGGAIPDGGFVDPAVPDFEPGGGTAGAAADGRPSGWIVALAVLAALAIAPALVRRARHRLAHGHDPVEQVGAAWKRARAAAERAGVTGTPAMTVSEWAMATAAQLPVAARPMRSLAEVVDRVTFAPPDEIDIERHGAFGSTLCDDCGLWAQQVDRIADDTLTWRQSLRRYFREY